MNRTAPALLAVTGAALIAAAPAVAAPASPGATATATATEAPRSSVEVIGARLYADTRGPGAGTLLARTKVRYRHSVAVRGQPWFGSTVITVRGPGGSKTVRDVDRLRHAAAGQIVDHRVVISRAEAARILGPAGVRAKVRLRVRGHLELRVPTGQASRREAGVPVCQSIGGGGGVCPGAAAPGGPGGNGGAAGAGVVAGNGGAGGDGGNAGLLGVAGNGGAGNFGAAGGMLTGPGYPPVGATWGNPDGDLMVNWTFSQPYQPYVAGLYIYDAGGGAGSVAMQPSYDGNDDPTSGVINPDNTFTVQSSLNDAYCVPGATFTATGAVPPHMSAQAGGGFTTGNAVASWSSGNCGTVATFGGPAATYFPGW